VKNADFSYPKKKKNIPADVLWFWPFPSYEGFLRFQHPKV
jgi:hypothetical protein